MTASTVPLDWMYGVFGGVFIGVSSSLYLALTGRIAGISGIFSVIINHLFSLGRDASKCACSAQFGFLAGLFCGGMYWNYVAQLANGVIDFHGLLPSKIEPFQALQYSPYVLLSSGLLVGFGTKIGNGCTSGHGVCGLARRSLRSFAAVATFMTTGIITCTVTGKYFAHLYEEHNVQLYEYEMSTPFGAMKSEYALSVIVAMLLFAGLLAGNFRSFLSSILSGFLFATGLIYAGMTKPDKIRSAFNLDPVGFEQRFDPSLFFVFVGALTNSSILFPLIQKYIKRPFCGEKFCIPTNTIVDARLITGAALFGIGWGIGGLCPGPAFVALSNKTASVPVWIWSAAFLSGNRAATLMLSKLT